MDKYVNINAGVEIRPPDRDGDIVIRLTARRDSKYAFIPFVELAGWVKRIEAELEAK